MRMLALLMQTSVDGFVAGPKGELDWMFPTLDDEASRWITARLWEAGVHAMGSRTYRDMASYWPRSKELAAAPMNEIPKVAFSRRGMASVGETTHGLKDALRARPIEEAHAGWDQPRVLTGELGDEIARLKNEPGKEILAHGGASFARSLVAEGLVDEFRLVIHPTALGAGLPLFAGLHAPLRLKLVSATSFAAGAVAHVYRGS